MLNKPIKSLKYSHWLGPRNGDLLYHFELLPAIAVFYTDVTCHEKGRSVCWALHVQFLFWGFELGYLRKYELTANS